MAIEIEKRFTVLAATEDVWSFLTEPERVAECLPGARVTHREEDGSVRGDMKVRLGPVSSTYEGEARFSTLDEETFTARLTATGRDSRGRGGAEMSMESRLVPTEAGTEVHVSSSVHVTGILVQIGRGMIEDVSDQLFERFTTCLKGKLEPTAPSSGDATDREDPEGPALTDDASRSSSASPIGDTAAPGAAGHPGRDDEPEVLELTGLGTRALRRASERMVRRPLFWVVVLLIIVALRLVLG